MCRKTIEMLVIHHSLCIKTYQNGEEGWNCLRYFNMRWKTRSSL